MIETPKSITDVTSSWLGEVLKADIDRITYYVGVDQERKHTEISARYWARAITRYRVS